MPAPDASNAVRPAAAPAPSMSRPAALTRRAFRKPLEMIDQMIKSGDFDVLFAALKGFRNGVVYGVRVRAPHALVLNLVWSKAPYSAMPAKIYSVTKTHALALGFSAVIFTLVRATLKWICGREALWHAALGSFLMGFVCWGDPSNPVHIQMMMYMLARNISAIYHLVTAKYGVVAPRHAFRFYMGALYAITIVLLIQHRETLQPSMAHSLQYIFLDGQKFNDWYDVFMVNTASTL